MDTQSIVTYKSAFDAIMHEIMADDGSQMEVWYARELQQVCGYARWENFQVAINRAKESCNSQNISIDDHFRDITKMVSLGSGQRRETVRCRTNTTKEIIPLRQRFGIPSLEEKK